MRGGGRRVIEEVFCENPGRETSPKKDYRHDLPIVRQLVLNAPDVGLGRGRTIIHLGRDPYEVVGNFGGGWAMGDYGLCFDLLVSNSPLLEGLSRDEWIDQRRKWADEAHPARFEPRLLRERERSQQSLWLPNPVLAGRSSTIREAEMGWSLEISHTLLRRILTEMPMGTAVNKETGRHWFWTSYTLVRDWRLCRVQRMADEGARAQGLPITELQER